MRILLLRHTHAGERARWHDDDRRRPLSPKGRKQAEALPGLYEGFDIGRILTSPYVRCVQSVEPLAQARQIEVEATDALAEGVARAAIEVLLDRLSDQDEDVVLCTHGDVVQNALFALNGNGADLGDDLRFQKGSTWVLEVSAGRVTAGRYLPPPEI